jgi:hypothetical protein
LDQPEDFGGQHTLKASIGSEVVREFLGDMVNISRTMAVPLKRDERINGSTMISSADRGRRLREINNRGPDRAIEQGVGITIEVLVLSLCQGTYMFYNA